MREGTVRRLRPGTAALVIAGAWGLLVLLTLPGRGVYWDELPQRLHGIAVLRWYLSGFSDTTVLEQGNLYLYGGVTELVLESANRIVPVDPYFLRHALVALLGLATVWGAYRLGCALGRPWIGVLAMALLAVSPRFTGHVFFNSKDVPVAAFYLWALILFLRDLRRPVGSSLRRVVPVGVVAGLALGTRIGAGILFVPLLAGYLTRWREEGGGRDGLTYLMARFSTVFLVAWGIMLLGWPWAISRPFVRPLAALLASSRFPWPQMQLFEGRVVSSLDLPWDYLPVWFARSLPEITLLGLASAALLVARRAKRPWPGLSPGVVATVLAAVVPLVYVVGGRVALYDATRHLLFLQPFIALAAAFGLAWIGGWWKAGATGAGQPASVRRIAVAGVLVTSGLALPAAEMWVMSPYEYVYFNRISGGLGAADGRFELDYWGLSYREALDSLDSVVGADPIRLASCSHPGSLEPFVPDHVRYVGSVVFPPVDPYDYLLLTDALDCITPQGEAFTVPDGERVPMVVRHGVALNELVRVGDPAR